MSKKVTPRFDYPAWVRSLTNLTKTAKLLYEELINCSGGIGTCWPSIRTLAKKLDCCKQSVIVAARMLESLGLIKKFKRLDLSTRCYTSNLYQILPIPAVDNPSAKPAPNYEYEPVPDFEVDESEPAKPAKKPFWKSAKKTKEVTDEESFLNECSQEDRDFFLKQKSDTKKTILDLYQSSLSEAKDKLRRIRMLQGLYIN